jgi:hypothetical protein
MSKFWHILASIGIAALGVALPPIQTAVVAHPVVSTVLGTIWAILGNILPTPTPKLFDKTA